jgi:hypothetical protein
MRENLPGAGTLPFAGFVTAELKWVAGFSGYKDAAGFLAVLESAEKSPLLLAKPDVAKKLDGLAAQAAKASEKADWKGVFAASKAAAALKGRSPAREKIAAEVAKARAAAESDLAKALESVSGGGDRAAARVALKKIATAFPGEPEQKDADLGVKALEKLTTIETLAAEQQTAAREKASKDFAGTRWAGLFEAK